MKDWDGAHTPAPQPWDKCPHPKFPSFKSRARFGTSKMHLSPPVAWAAVRSKVVVLLLLTFCLLLLPLGESVIVLCFVVRYFMSILNSSC